MHPTEFTAPADGLDVLLWAGYAAKKGAVTVTEAFLLKGAFGFLCLYISVDCSLATDGACPSIATTPKYNSQNHLNNPPSSHPPPPPTGTTAGARAAPIPGMTPPPVFAAAAAAAAPAAKQVEEQAQQASQQQQGNLRG